MERHEGVDYLSRKGLSKRAVCRWTGWSRAIARYQLQQPVRDGSLLKRMREVTQAHPRFGYRRVAVLVSASNERVRRLWCQHSFRLGSQRVSRGAPRQPQLRLHHAEHPNQVWTYAAILNLKKVGETLPTGRRMC